MSQAKNMLWVAACLAAVWLVGCGRHDVQPGAAVLAGLAPAASSPAMRVASQPAAHQIGIDNFTYSPSELTVPVGTTVTWINHDDVPHTVTSDGGKGPLSSAALDTDDKYSYRFSTAGVYPYFCKVHPHMTGRITVR